MCKMRRLSLDLSAFFDNHIARSYIFINDKMKYIRDLEDKIASLFNIYTFCVTQNGHYLPEDEEILVIFPDSPVRVVPPYRFNNEKKKIQKKRHEAKEVMKQEDNDQLQFNTIEEENVGKINKRKSSKSDGKDQESESVPKKKSKKNEVAVTKKRKHQKSEENLNQYENQQNATDNENVDKKVEKISNKKTLSVSFEDHLKKIMLSKDEIMQRPPNIVKIIKVSKDNSFEITTKANTKSVTDSDNENNVENLDIVDALPKKRRNRIRKRRKPKQIALEHDQNVCEMPSTLIGPELPKSRLHIKFADEENNTEKEKITQSSNYPIENGLNNVIEEKILNEFETIQHSSNNINIQNGYHENITNNLTNGTTTSNGIIENNLLENHSKIDTEQKEVVLNGDNTYDSEFIMKHPPCLNASPKVGDIYAFRTLRLDENYTPGFSGYIVGEVMEFNQNNLEVTMRIIQGIKDLMPPNDGKFSIQEQEEGELESEENKIHVLLWKDLLNPRLLSE